MAMSPINLTNKMIVIIEFPIIVIWFIPIFKAPVIDDLFLIIGVDWSIAIMQHVIIVLREVTTIDLLLLFNRL